MQENRTVFVIDDDPELRASVCALVSSLGCEAEAFASAEEFLESGAVHRRGVVVTDLRMPGMSGVELQEELARRNAHLPLIVITAYAQTTTTVRAMKGGAVTLIEKPYSGDELWTAIRQAFALEAAGWTERERRRKILERLDCLEPAERLVMDLLISGMQNKAIAMQLDLSVRTVEKRRHNTFVKMGVDSLPELVALVIESRRGG